jgi:hypothetical protein
MGRGQDGQLVEHLHAWDNASKNWRHKAFERRKLTP